MSDTTPRRKKHPRDYPRFGFRTTESRKREIMHLVDELQYLSNRDLAPELRRLSKSDIIVKALRLGLYELLSTHTNKSSEPKPPSSENDTEIG